MVTRGLSQDAKSQILEVRVRNFACDSELKFVSNNEIDPNTNHRRRLT